MSTFDILEWDTQTFGFKVARIRECVHSPRTLRECLDELRREQVVLAYWFADDDPGVKPIVEQCQGTIVDRKATYSGNISSSPAAKMAWPGDIDDAQASDSAALELLSIQCGENSRYARDPHFPRDRFEMLYLEWIRKSIAGILADRVLVSRAPDSSIHGMITISARDAVASIGLLGVSLHCRGRGIGHHLVQAAQLYALQRGATQCEVVTQQGNVAACRLYEDCGFRLRSIQIITHFWLGDIS